MAPSFVLASASARRRELLARVGLWPEVRPSNVDERVLPREDPERYAVRVALDKARASTAEGAVLAADTVVAFDGRSLGKPDDAASAEQMLGRLSGQTHWVHTGVVLRGSDGAFVSCRVSTRVRFRNLGSREISEYVASGEFEGKAGSYAVQGLGGALIAEIHGSYTNVVGLPLEETLELLQQAGLR